MWLILFGCILGIVIIVCVITTALWEDHTLFRD
jgi:hypothetical protein